MALILPVPCHCVLGHTYGSDCTRFSGFLNQFSVIAVDSSLVVLIVPVPCHCVLGQTCGSDCTSSLS